jgi:hypothetical protein
MRRSSWITRGLLMTDQHHNEHQAGLGFERQDWTGRPVYGFLVSLAVIGVMVYVTVWGIFKVLDRYFNEHQAPANPLVEQNTSVPTRNADPERVQQIFPEPRLETNERGEINDFRLGEEQTLNSYGWVDEKAGVAHIPITEAMRLVAQRGLPTKPAIGKVPPSPVNLARAAAAAADTANANQNTAGRPAGKRKK